jgi:hypothetical protein
LSKATLAAALASALLAWNCRSLLSDVWLVRLNNAWPGGSFLAFAEDGRECLAVYRFSSGAGLLLDNGAAWHNPETSAKREAHLPLLMHGSARSVLLIGARHPATLAAARAHGLETTSLDPHPDAGAVLRSQAADGRPPAGIKTIRADPRGYLRRAGPAYDAIIVETPFPAHAPEAARLVTMEAMAEVRARLAPGGVAAWRLPAPYSHMSRERTIQAARRTFAHTGGFRLPGGWLLICSQQPLDSGPAALRARLGPRVRADDAALADDLSKLPWAASAPDDSKAARPDTDDRLRGTLSLPAIWSGRIFTAETAEAPVL